MQGFRQSSTKVLINNELDKYIGLISFQFNFFILIDGGLTALANPIDEIPPAWLKLLARRDEIETLGDLLHNRYYR
ncbi:MAG: hypothetical protein CFE23_06240 [Flavobacterium sp. BFFFF1]|nr:MAG: hypothetical protein CFE23_06240 [Flavobacterium sp. BFFFF1]